MPADRPGFPAYIRSSTDRLIVVEENKRRATFRNLANELVLVVHVDGEMITAGERADYVVAHSNKVDVIVELKGSDVGKAVRQIRATRPAWLHCSYAGTRQAALVVRSPGMHPRQTANIERWQREFRKTLKMKLIVETRNREYEFNEFLLPEVS